MRYEEKLRDRIAIAAMSAIISKTPLLGLSFNHDVGQESIDRNTADAVLMGISSAAYEYADWMLKARKK